MSQHDEESRRLAGLLGDLIRLSRRSLRSLERDLEISSAGLSKILNGTVRLQMTHILSIVETLGIPPGSFFQLAFPKTEPPNPLIRQLHGMLGEEAPAEVEDSTEFDEQVRQALVRLLGSTG
jgi:transcriptional regulator with XRE-family HTH domain